MNSNKEGKTKYLTILELKHPENLSKECLLLLLKERYMGNKSLDDLDKIDLIDLYHETILPYPQREYQQNKRGTLLTKVREERANERDNKEEDPMQSSGTTVSILYSSKRKQYDDDKESKEDKKIISLAHNSHKSPNKGNRHSPNGTGKSNKLLCVEKRLSKRPASIESEGSDSDTKKHKQIKWP